MRAMTAAVAVLALALGGCGGDKEPTQRDRVYWSRYVMCYERKFGPMVDDTGVFIDPATDPDGYAEAYGPPAAFADAGSDGCRHAVEGKQPRTTAGHDKCAVIPPLCD